MIDLELCNVHTGSLSNQHDGDKHHHEEDEGLHIGHLADLIWSKIDVEILGFLAENTRSLQKCDDASAKNSIKMVTLAIAI